MKYKKNAYTPFEPVAEDYGPPSPIKEATTSEIILFAAVLGGAWLFKKIIENPVNPNEIYGPTETPTLEWDYPGFHKLSLDQKNKVLDLPQAVRKDVVTSLANEIANPKPFASRTIPYIQSSSEQAQYPTGTSSPGSLASQYGQKSGSSDVTGTRQVASRTLKGAYFANLGDALNEQYGPPNPLTPAQQEAATAIAQAIWNSEPTVTATTTSDTVAPNYFPLYAFSAIALTLALWPWKSSTKEVTQ